MEGQSQLSCLHRANARAGLEKLTRGPVRFQSDAWALTSSGQSVDHPNVHISVLELALVCTLSACATTLSPQAAMVRDVDKSATSACQFLGIVQGSSSQTGVANRATGEHNARNEAREKAAALGANYVAWVSDDASFASIDVQAEAYQCP